MRVSPIHIRQAKRANVPQSLASAKFPVASGSLAVDLMLLLIERANALSVQSEMAHVDNLHRVASEEDPTRG